MVSSNAAQGVDAFRRWSGNELDVVNWYKDGKELQTTKHHTDDRIGATNFNLDYIFQPNVSWGAISSSAFSARVSYGGSLFDAAGCACFSPKGQLHAVLGALNSTPAYVFLNALNPTLNFPPGVVGEIPFPSGKISEQLDEVVSSLVQLMNEDWNTNEISRGFKKASLCGESSCEAGLQSLRSVRESRSKKITQLECENDAMLMRAYGIEDVRFSEIAPRTALEDISAESEVRKLLSYAIGCILGRYNLDKTGLIYANSGNQGFDPSQYKTFRADDDGIIPLLETDWGIRDDAANRIVEFIGVAWPRERLEENLKFIADSIGPTNGERPRDTIRRYLANGFYKHHLWMYKKRPIYWLFSSGRQRAFQCLVYLHRYHEGTLARMRTEYVIPLQAQIAARIEQLEGDKTKATSYPDAATMYRAYESELFRFDQLYRHFCEAADTAEEQGWNIVKPLRADIEAHYVNWYLTNLALAWGKFIEPQGGLLSKWQIDEVPNQQRFYERNVRPWLQEADNRRAFVIISDAFRYEAAQELTAELNGKYRFEATLSSQLGVLPSYTALGMASLLPHKTLAYKGIDVLVDSKSSIAGERGSILQSVGGLACKFDELMAKKKEEGREFVKDKRIVYIYHNAVDAVGDDGKTEGKTFGAVRTAINELAALVGYIVNNLNGHHIIVTADHGFLFTETARVETDKSKLKDKPDSTILAKKRYLIGKKLHADDAAWHGKLSVTAGVDDDMEFWIPKGANLFHFLGGARFVHGGAMPQEIVVPVVTVKHIRGKSAQETKTKPVTIQVLGSNHRITSAFCRFQLIQMETVSERVKPITLRVAVYEGEEPVTDIQTVKFDSTSGNLDERKKWVNLVLKDRQYSKKTPYRLVLRDVETGIEQQNVEVIIDRAFTDDF
jgi:PglZ domain